MNNHERQVWFIKWAIRVSVVLGIVFIVVVLFFFTGFTVKWLISIKTKAENATTQAVENTTAIQENSDDIQELQEASPAPTATATPRVTAGRSERQHNKPKPRQRSWLERLFRP